MNSLRRTGLRSIFGCGLEKAVKAFQMAKGLSADGIAGKATLFLVPLRNCFYRSNDITIFKLKLYIFFSVSIVI
ncbi:peptidoglycan-binding domain-containing protein [Bacillus sonorensis]|uniref:peptidoglycan-binding domain-containing protein n=2 Tax=Bacillus sonorensis TaxID=119858 RepID=UPI00398B0324